jgi:hypothetical protein
MNLPVQTDRKRKHMLENGFLRLYVHCFALNEKKKRQCKCNVVLKPFLVTIVALKNNITYTEGVFVALGIQHAKQMPHIAICGLPSSTKGFHIIS